MQVVWFVMLVGLPLLFFLMHQWSQSLSFWLTVPGTCRLDLPPCQEFQRLADVLQDHRLVSIVSLIVNFLCFVMQVSVCECVGVGS